MDIWNNEFEMIELSINKSCKACASKTFDFLNRESDESVYLCGKNSVQINPIQKNISEENLLNRLDSLGLEYKKNAYFIKFTVEEVQFTLFYDGRAILKNTSDKIRAQSLYAKYIGL